MAPSLGLLAALFTLVAMVALEGNIAEAIRPVAAPATQPIEAPNPVQSLAARLRLNVKAEGDNATLTTCWDTLLQLQSCSNEVIVFFLNGETTIGSECCQAIYTIEHHCWPSMLTALGYNSEESDVLRGYCDASDSEAHSPPSHLDHEQHLKDPEMAKNHTPVIKT